MNITIKHVPIFPDNPQNPAKCNIKTGVITLNDSVWNKLTPLEQQYWLAHEEGHIRTRGGSEVEADIYAFKMVAGSQPYSLRDIRRSMQKIIATNPNAPEAKARIDNNMRLSLQMAADRGSESAKQLLIKIPNSMATPIKSTTALMSSSNVNLAVAQKVTDQLSATVAPVKSTTKTTASVSTKATTTVSTKSTTAVSTKATTSTPIKATTKVLDMGNKAPVSAPVTQPASTAMTSQATTLTPRVNGSIVPNRTIIPVPTGNVVFAETEVKPIIVPIPLAEIETSTVREETTMGTIVDPTQPTIMQENPAQAEGGSDEPSKRHQAPAKETVEDKPAITQSTTQNESKGESKNKNILYIVAGLVVVAVGYFIYKSKNK